jgi:hypothetical protein
MGEQKETRDPDAGDAMEAFFSQFGELDPHASMVLEEFFRELMGGEEE